MAAGTQRSKSFQAIAASTGSGTTPGGKDSTTYPSALQARIEPAVGIHARGTPAPIAIHTRIPSLTWGKSRSNAATNTA